VIRVWKLVGFGIGVIGTVLTTVRDTKGAGNLPTAEGWVYVGLIILGFGLSVFTDDREEQQKRKESLEAQRKAIEEQRHLNYQLRRLMNPIDKDLKLVFYTVIKVPEKYLSTDGWPQFLTDGKKAQQFEGRHGGSAYIGTESEAEQLLRMLIDGGRFSFLVFEKDGVTIEDVRNRYYKVSNKVLLYIEATSEVEPNEKPEIQYPRLGIHIPCKTTHFARDVDLTSILDLSGKEFVFGYPKVRLGYDEPHLTYEPIEVFAHSTIGVHLDTVNFELLEDDGLKFYYKGRFPIFHGPDARDPWEEFTAALEKED
jgi:hypothetical protein